ncbi:Rieske (2Fe-2S) protein [Deinococcus sp. Arct2-2]|uniref:QcrA and Rieske domain-containing protein n=1 Tax=Deinococcus sp. Arct2-2 TaxID=2568653 RepID=UPI0010A318C7|nr:Rieske (2Fe-2S) protein [Deinococcus sp. Arct2-2]THF71339.1 Rieske (2Fe-2S) protein [Deinococcus sp. Arct2-2]
MTPNPEQVTATPHATARRTTVKLLGGAVLLTGCAPMMQPMMKADTPAAAPAPAAATPAPAAAPASTASPASSSAPMGAATLAAFPAVGSTVFLQQSGKGVVIARIAAAQAGAATSGDIHLLALSDRCTHLGCGVQAAASGGGYSCPCHGSAFTLTGDVVKGPAARPLDRLAIRIEGDQVFVG